MVTSSFSLFVFALIWLSTPCSSLYDCRSHPDSPILCPENQIRTSISHCSGEASVCEGVSSWGLTLNCSSCSLAKEVHWKFGSSQSLPYKTSIAQIPAGDVQLDASGCYTCVCDDNSYSFTVDIRAADCPHLLVRNDTEDDEVYLCPPMVETELTDTSEGIVLVNCSSSGWPTPTITWSVDVHGNRSSIYNFPNYNVTENGQVLVILFPSLEEIDTLVTYHCLVHNAVGSVLAEQTIHILAYYNYFLKPHTSQSHGSVEIQDGQEGVAYCAVNPENGVDIDYTVCAYHGGETDLDWVASPFIANGSSHCCWCGACGEGVLGSGVTAFLSLSPPNSNNFSVRACEVHSKTAVDGDFVCLANRLTELQPSAKQALATFRFQHTRLPSCSLQPLIPFSVSVTFIVVAALQCPVMILSIICCAIYKCKAIRKGTDSKSTTSRSKGGGGTFQRGLQQGANGTESATLLEVHEPFEMDRIADFIPDMAPQWSMIGCKLSLTDEVEEWMLNTRKCYNIINAAIQQQKLTCWQDLFNVLESDAVKLPKVACSIRMRYGSQPGTDDTGSRSTENDQEHLITT